MSKSRSILELLESGYQYGDQPSPDELVRYGIPEDPNKKEERVQYSVGIPKNLMFYARTLIEQNVVDVTSMAAFIRMAVRHEIERHIDRVGNKQIRNNVKRAHAIRQEFQTAKEMTENANSAKVLRGLVLKYLKVGLVDTARETVKSAAYLLDDVPPATKRQVIGAPLGRSLDHYEEGEDETADFIVFELGRLEQEGLGPDPMRRAIHAAVINKTGAEVKYGSE